jgi:biopolymer transport protein ExbD
MGASIDTGNDKRSVDVHLNIVPFIDLMSCLTAFLLVTAVWTNLAQIIIKPKGVGTHGPDGPETIQASILIQENAIWVGLSRINEFRQVKKEGEEYDWAALREVLVEHKENHFQDSESIEVAAEDAIAYESIIAVMDTAVAAGFKDVGLADPASLSARPQL